MKIYDHILQGSTLQNAIDHANGLHWPEIEYKEIEHLSIISNDYKYYGFVLEGKEE